MAAVRVTVAMQEQILELFRQGRSERAIAKIVDKNRRTVSRIINRGTVAKPGAVAADWAMQID